MIGFFKRHRLPEKEVQEREEKANSARIEMDAMHKRLEEAVIKLLKEGKTE